MQLVGLAGNFPLSALEVMHSEISGTKNKSRQLREPRRQAMEGADLQLEGSSGWVGPTSAHGRAQLDPAVQARRGLHHLISASRRPMATQPHHRRCQLIRAYRAAPPSAYTPA